MSENTNDGAVLVTFPPAARAALALKSADTEQHLRGLIVKSAAITNVVDKNGRDEAHGAAMMLKNARTTIVATGKAAREDATAFSKAVIAEEKRLIDITADEEARLFGLRDAFDAKVAAEKAERERIDAERKAKIRAKIDDILRLPATSAGHASIALTGLLEVLARRDITPEEFAEFTDEARTAVDTVASALIELRDAAAQREEQARQEAAARRAEAERMEAERAALAAQKAEQDRVAAELAAGRAELARIQEETERTRIQVAAERAESQRKEREAADAERRKLEQAAADLEEQRAAFAREQEEARQAAEARARAEEVAASQPAPEPAPAAPVIEILPPEPEMPGLIEAADQFAEEVRPDDEEIIAALCERFDLVPPQVVDLLARFDFAAARVRHAI